MGITVSSKKETSKTDYKLKEASPKLERNFRRSSSRYLHLSTPDSGCPSTPYSTDANKQDVDTPDILSVDDLWCPGDKNKPESKRNFILMGETTDPDVFIREDVDFIDSDSLRTIAIPGAIASRESQTKREKRDRETIYSHWALDGKGKGSKRETDEDDECSLILDTRRQNTTAVENRPRAASVEGYRLRSSSSKPLTSDEKQWGKWSSDEYEHGNTSDPKNRPRAANQRQRNCVGNERGRPKTKNRMTSDECWNTDESDRWTFDQCGENNIDLCSFLSQFLEENQSDFSGDKVYANTKKKGRKKFQLQVTINPNSDVCQIILPGDFIFNSTKSKAFPKKRLLKRHRSLFSPSDLT